MQGKLCCTFPAARGLTRPSPPPRLGAPTTLIGRVGKDAFGLDLKAFLATQGVGLTFVKDAEAHTGTAIITVANADNTIVVVPGANAMVDANDIAAPVLAKGDVAVSQFEIPLPTITAFFRQARAAGATTILNPAPAQTFDAELLGLVDILILNETELGFLTGTELRDRDNDEAFIDAARSLQTDKDQAVCVTLGRRGIWRSSTAGSSRPGRAVKAVDTTGAGDCFVGAVAAQLASGNPIRDALGYANIAASICVQRMGAAPSMPTAAEVEAAISNGRPGESRDP